MDYKTRKISCSRIDVAVLRILENASQLREPVVDYRVDGAETKGRRICGVAGGV